MKKFTDYIEEHPIFEMATMNLLTPSSGPLPSNKYKVEMYSSEISDEKNSNDHTPPHLHVIVDDCNLEFYIETGEFYKYKKNSKELNSKEFTKLSKLIKTWLFDTKRSGDTYQKICYQQWLTWYGYDGFSKEFIDKMSK